MAQLIKPDAQFQAQGQTIPLEGELNQRFIAMPGERGAEIGDQEMQEGADLGKLGMDQIREGGQGESQGASMISKAINSMAGMASQVASSQQSADSGDPNQQGQSAKGLQKMMKMSQGGSGRGRVAVNGQGTLAFGPTHIQGPGMPTGGGYGQIMNNQGMFNSTGSGMSSPSIMNPSNMGDEANV